MTLIVNTLETLLGGGSRFAHVKDVDEAGCEVCSRLQTFPGGLGRLGAEMPS